MGTEWLKASLRDAFNRESQRRFTVFAGCGYAAASAGEISAGTPPVLLTTSDDGQRSLGHRCHLVELDAPSGVWLDRTAVGEHNLRPPHNS